MGGEVTKRLYPLSELPETLSVSAASVTGSRPYQEDCLMYQVYEDGALGIVCDGMGGLAQGARASACAVDSVSEYFRRYPRSLSNMQNYWWNAICDADGKVAALTDAAGHLAGCGTTIAAVFVSNGKMTWASAGDSMVFLFRAGECIPLVRMHNYGMLLDERCKKDMVSPEAYAMENCQREALVSYLGMNGIEIWDCSREPLKLESGDKILLCSDGLYKSLSVDQIREVLAACDGEQFQQTAIEFIRAVYRRKAENLDNISILCFDYRNISDEENGGVEYEINSMQ